MIVLDVYKRQKMGSPYQTGDLTKNEKQLKVAHYAYASTGGDSAYPEAVSYTHLDVYKRQYFGRSAAR